MKVFLLMVMISASQIWGQNEAKSSNGEALERGLQILSEKLEETNEKIRIMEEERNEFVNQLLAVLGNRFDQVADLMDTKVEATIEQVNATLSLQSALCDQKLEAVADKLAYFDSKLELNEQIVTQVEKLNQEQEAKTSSVFAAYGLRAGPNEYQRGERLKYLNPAVNPGGRYSNITGEYTCGQSGVYYFTFSIFGSNVEDGYHGSLGSATLIKDGEVIGKNFVSNYNGERVLMSLSYSVMVQCDAGEKVWVESSHNNNNLDGLPAHNMFSGMLISQK